MLETSSVYHGLWRALVEHRWETTDYFHMPIGEWMLITFEFLVLMGIRSGSHPVDVDPSLLSLNRLVDLLGFALELSGSSLIEAFAASLGVILFLAFAEMRGNSTLLPRQEGLSSVDGDIPDSYSSPSRHARRYRHCRPGSQGIDPFLSLGGIYNIRVLSTLAIKVDPTANRSLEVCFDILGGMEAGFGPRGVLIPSIETSVASGTSSGHIPPSFEVSVIGLLLACLTPIYQSRALFASSKGITADLFSFCLFDSLLLSGSRDVYCCGLPSECFVRGANPGGLP
ncbi:hypothetical protein JCGZ_00511 [Jatropha curcas]|uniref:Aminotransferase-like plant mobile domain-containing protein n=1 Tax=Jatropha curcas TaxID=180498 RepID=A0A067JGJ1_JATCU|nr:hypothetical protein JCGZ_00511 [Jatropha curcas]